VAGASGKQAAAVGRVVEVADVAWLVCMMMLNDNEVPAKRSVVTVVSPANRR